MPVRGRVCWKCELWFSNLEGNLAVRDEDQSDQEDDLEYRLDIGLSDGDESGEELSNLGATNKQGSGMPKKKFSINKINPEKLVYKVKNSGTRMSKHYDLHKEGHEEEDVEEDEQPQPNSKDRKYAEDR